MIKEIQQMGIQGLTPSAILARLTKDSRFAGRVFPTARSITDWIAPYRPRDPSGPWCLDKLAISQGQAVLPVLAEVITLTDGQITGLTNAEAEWLVTIIGIAPDWSPRSQFLQARLYSQLDRDAATDSERSRQPDRIASDAHLGFAPWRSSEAGTKYIQAIQAGFIPKHPLFRYGSAHFSAHAALVAEGHVSGAVR